jgi:hypothetical protein
MKPYFKDLRFGEHYFKPAASEMIERKNRERKTEELKERP